jgi:anti-sigma regulatory factor (Ser/Thr protein kinase)
MSGTSAYPPSLPVLTAGSAGGRPDARSGGRVAGTGRDRGLVPVPPPWSDQVVLAEGWPLRDFIELGSLPGAVPCARYHSRFVLREWRLSELADSAELLISELMTNAITANQATGVGSSVRLWLLADCARLLILVQDGSPHPPIPTVPGAHAERGRGLLLVDAISSRWDWYVPSVGSGKVTWALLEMAFAGE